MESLLKMLLPEGFSLEDVEALFKQYGQLLEENNVMLKFLVFGCGENHESNYVKLLERMTEIKERYKK
jgi:hypothetical protein